MKYSKEQILEKYKHKNLDIFSRFDLEKYGLTDDHLIIDFSEPTNVLSKTYDNLNQKILRDIYEKDYDLVCNTILKNEFGLTHNLEVRFRLMLQDHPGINDFLGDPKEEWFKLILQENRLDFENDMDKDVDLVSLEDKIVNFPLIIFRIAYIKAVLAINMDINRRNEFKHVNPFLLLFHKRSLRVDFLFFIINPNDLEKKKGSDSYISFHTFLYCPLEVKPFEVTGEK